MAAKNILAIDNGTQSVRALVFDAEGNLLFKSQVPIDDYASPYSGWSELDPARFWDQLRRACTGVWERGADPSTIACIGVTTQRGTMINVDDRGRALRPAITWMDERQQTELPAMPLHWRLLFRAARQSDAIQAIRQEAESNWIRYNEPDVWQATHKFLQLSGFFNYRLTGAFRDSIGSQVGFVPLDYKRQRWASGSHWLWLAYGIKPQQLPELVRPGDRIGILTSEAAGELGLPEGVPVIAAASDKACEIVGAGVSDASIGCLSFGTRATASIHAKRYFEASPPLPPFPAALPGMFAPEAAVVLGFWMVSWFKRQFGHPERELAKTRGVSPESLFDELLRNTPPGSRGLVLRPNWGRGIGRGAPPSGAIIGFGDVHARDHLYRAIVEGIAYELRAGLAAIEKKSGTRIERLRISGGGSQSDAIMQTAADIFNLPAERAHTFETSGLGAAVVASVGAAIHPDFRTAMKRMTRPGDTFEPDAANARVYERLFREVYLPMDERLAPLDIALRQIIG